MDPTGPMIIIVNTLHDPNNVHYVWWAHHSVIYNSAGPRYFLGSRLGPSTNMVAIRFR